MSLALAELAAVVALVALIAATMRHACDPQRIDRRLYAGRHHMAGGAR